MEGLRLEIVTPDKVVLETTVDYVGAPGVDGQFGVMPGHIPLLSALNIGELYYRNGSATNWVFVGGGFVEVSDDKVSILAEAAELSENIDLDRAKAALKRAEDRLAAHAAELDETRAVAALQRALTRIHTASH